MYLNKKDIKVFTSSPEELEIKLQSKIFNL